MERDRATELKTSMKLIPNNNLLCVLPNRSFPPFKIMVMMSEEPITENDPDIPVIHDISFHCVGV